MTSLTIELINDNAIHLLQDLELLNIIRLPNKNIEIPDWHKAILDERIADYENNPTEVGDIDSLLDEVEKSI